METSELFQTLLATAIDSIVVIDARGAVKIYNDACEKLFQYRPDEVIGRNVSMLMPSPYREEHDSYLERYRTTGERRIIGLGRAVSGMRKDGSTFPMYLSVGEGRLGSERIFVGIIHDMTEQVGRETAIKEREALLTSVLNTAPDAIITINERGSIESFNAAASHLFGYTPEEVHGKNVSVLMPEPYRSDHDGYITRYLETGEKRIIGIGRVVVGRRKDGTTFPMELAVGEAQIGARKVFTGFVRDITQREGRERQVHELQRELLHVSRLSAMGEMASALAHELNQPLTAITNYMLAAKRTMAMPEQPAEKTTELMDKVSAQALRAGEIIRRLRAFIDRREVARSPEDINQIVEESMALSFVGSAAHNITVTLDLERSPPCAIVDKIQIQQVLINLIRNALEAMQDAAHRQLTISTSLQGENLQVGVSDTGLGLSKDVTSRLFQPFVTTKANGMGIGLSICQSIIESHGGRIWAKPNGNGGTTFAFELPVVRPNER